MKIITDFLIGLLIGLLISFIIFCYFRPIPVKHIMNSPYFEIDGKEWQCGFTPRQVEINLLEDKIQKLKQ